MNENYNSKVSMGSAITDNSLMNSSPFTKKVLKRFDVIGPEIKKNNISFQDTFKGLPSLRTSQFELKTEGDNESRLSNLEKFKRPSGEKSFARVKFKDRSQII